ncbi:hypothetical protein PHSY_006267 [Pseudozyma hubeiensis SY62]|uniref:Uncharacterized protein n=1 Tax=Pseudozyma hubeiensis (strain SY62) TaxID=1305764 RepID=R9PB86_PSEHS|nr:hypothetical protein PHSY_006267 [Pseudozyma hubeiensis SY62]GAC98673.1 hypothetical protein PHSY_006267 [Pseudozyma hubeiensis SY62]
MSTLYQTKCPQVSLGANAPGKSSGDNGRVEPTMKATAEREGFRFLRSEHDFWLCLSFMAVSRRRWWWWRRRRVWPIVAVARFGFGKRCAAAERRL